MHYVASDLILQYSNIGRSTVNYLIEALIQIEARLE